MKYTEEEEIFAEVFHTGLRKALDGNASSICWNAIHIMGGKDWCAFVKKVTAARKAKPLSRSMCLDAIDYGESSRNLLKIGLEMLTDEEYDILDGWIRDCT